MRDNKYSDIFLAAHALFIRQGYEATTMREIASKAGVSLGMPNHLFGSKQALAGKTLAMLFAYTKQKCDPMLPEQKLKPLLATALNTRVNTLYFLNSGYRQFYIDCLKADIFFELINRSSNYSLGQLALIYHFPVNEDLFTLYGKYVPYQCEKTLVLHKEEGQFQSIGYDEIPDYILRSKFDHFLDTALLEPALKEAHSLSEKVLLTLSDPVPEDFIRTFLEADENSYHIFT